jgi:hypothetical protein
MIKLFQLLTGTQADDFLKSSGEPGVAVTSIPSDVLEVEYGDCRFPTGRVINLSCDIMDYNFWHYYKICSKYGRFCFSVNSEECDPQVYLSTVDYLKRDGGVFQEYWGMFE